MRGERRIPAGAQIAVSCSGGMFQPGNRLREPLEARLRRCTTRYRFVEPMLPPDVSAAIHAARLNGTSRGAAALEAPRVQGSDG